MREVRDSLTSPANQYTKMQEMGPTVHSPSSSLDLKPDISATARIVRITIIYIKKDIYSITPT